MMQISEDEYQIVSSFSQKFGIGQKINETEATELCLKSAAKGNLVAKGMKNFMGWEKKKDYKKALRYFLESYHADKEIRRKDTPYSLNMLGFMYINGFGTEIDHSKAIDFYEKAIEKNNTMALYNIGHMYENGLATEKDIKKAIECYKQASDLGSCYAMNNLAYFLEKGQEIKKDISRAISLYKKSAKFGYSLPYYNLAYIHKEGKNLPKDIDTAAHYFYKAFLVGDYLSDLCRSKFLNILNKKVEWKREYHPYWKKQNDLDAQIMTLFLISKNRKYSSYSHVRKHMVRDVSTSITKFLCHYKQRTYK